MADTGAPWNIPFVTPTDNPRVFPAADEAQALAIAAGLDAAGGLVEVKTAILTTTQSNSTAAAGNFTITGLSITHEVADPANRLIILASVGVAASTAQEGNVGIAVYQDGTAIGVGTSTGSNRVPVMAGGSVSGATGNFVVTMPSGHFVHTPGAGSKVYTLRALNNRNATQTIYINRAEADLDQQFFTRGISSLTIMEVKV